MLEFANGDALTYTLKVANRAVAVFVVTWDEHNGVFDIALEDGNRKTYGYIEAKAPLGDCGILQIRRLQSNPAQGKYNEP